MSTLTIHNIDPGLKAAALEIMKQHGLTARDTISSFLAKIVNDHQQNNDFCFCSNLELNEETRKELAAAKSGKAAYTRCKNTTELFNKLGI